MRKAGEFAYVFLFGCFMYSLMEIAARGYTHWSMTLTGGVCFAYIYHVTNERKMPLFLKCAAGTLFITSAEFAVGIFDNIIMKWNVWDYSDMPANLLGQICIPFSVLWFVLCFAGCYLSRVINIRLAADRNVKLKTVSGSDEISETV